jgi:type VI secretion system protein ImpC
MEDLESAAEFDQSALYKKIYEDEYGRFGGTPYGVLIGDYEINNQPNDLSFIEKISGVAAVAHAPFIAAAAPELFGLDNFTQLGKPRDLAGIFQTVEYAKWGSIRESQDAHYVSLVLPHILMRLPYGNQTHPIEAFDFEEDVDGADHTKFVWGNATYALGTRLTDAFAKYHWSASIRGVEGGGLVTGLPVYTFKADAGGVALKCPTEIAITDRREYELADLGFIPLVHARGTDYAAFFSNQTLQKPPVYDDAEATANARLASRLPYVLVLSRFAHYLTSIMRDKIGSFMSHEDAETFLNRWISQYVLLDDNASSDFKAKFPLREARINVSEVEGKPGAYRAVAILRPHYQLDELTTALRLVVDLPPPALDERH